MYDDGSIFPNHPWIFNFSLDGCEIQPATETEDIYDIPVSCRRIIEEQGEETIFFYSTRSFKIRIKPKILKINK